MNDVFDFNNVDLTEIEKAVMQDNCIACTFRSGGDLRTMKIEKKNRENTIVGYGDHTNFIPMLEKVSINYKNGGPVYKTEHYSGSSNPDCMLDVWTLQSGKIFIEKAKKGLKVSLKYWTGRTVYEVNATTLADAFNNLEQWLYNIDLNELNSYLYEECFNSNKKEEPLNVLPFVKILKR